MLITYRCPEMDCRKKFRWDPSDGDPKACPHCGFQTAPTDNNVVSLPAILSAKTRANDGVLKGIADGSSERALLAAQITGDSTADMSALKITDFKDQSPGYAPPVAESNAVSQHMDKTGYGGFAGGTTADVNQHTQQAMQLAAAAHTGPDARAGARAMGSLQKALFNVK